MLAIYIADKGLMLIINEQLPQIQAKPGKGYEYVVKEKQPINMKNMFRLFNNQCGLT